MEITKEKVELIKIVTDGLYRKILALIIIVFGGNFLFDVADVVKGEIRMMIVASLLTLVASIIGFYFGTSQSSQDKDKKLTAVEGTNHLDEKEV